MADEAVIKVRLDVTEAKARQKELDAGFQKATEAAGGVGRALFGGLVGGTIGGLIGSVVGSVTGPAMASVRSAFEQATGISKITDRVGAAESARDQMASQMGYAANFMSPQELAGIGKVMLDFQDAVAAGSRRIEQLFRPEILQRTDDWIPKSLQFLRNPDSLLR